MSEVPDLTLGKYIRELRLAKGLSLIDLSARTKNGYSHLSRIENESTIPSPETIVKLTNELGGDLTIMLQKADNLPRVILDRLVERDKVVRVQALNRSLRTPQEMGDTDAEAIGESVDRAGLNEQEVAALRQAVDELIALRPHARRAIMQLISVLHDDEGDGVQD